jgi:hypothetical protein
MNKASYALVLDSNPPLKTNMPLLHVTLYCTSSDLSIGRPQFEGIATKTNDSGVSVLISEFDHTSQSYMCKLKEPELYMICLTISLEDQIKKDDTSL